MTGKRGFLLGKFMPPHRGHRFLCDTARALVDTLTVLVCSTDADPIPGEKRFQWMREAAAHSTVSHLHRNLPQAPADHPDFWTIWRDAIREVHPKAITHVFASEPYVFRLAKELSAAPILIDPNREVFNISASAIRENPAAQWADIAPPARRYFQKRLCLTGPESVGKSRLCKTLADHFNTRFMPEYGRTYDIAYKQEKGWTKADLVTLAETHIAMRDALSPVAGPLLIEDTDAIQTALWAEYLLGAPALDDFAARASHADHYLLLAPSVEWIDDGVRYAGNEKARRWFFEEARKRFEKLNLSYSVIDDSDWDRRTAQAIEIASTLIKC